MAQRTFRQFATETEAREYRHEHGTGGWIFVGENGGPVYLFPPDMTPTPILHHPLVRGLAGNLIGCG